MESDEVMTTEMQYAALGDSYSAAPFVPQTDLGNTGVVPPAIPARPFNRP